MPGPTESPQLFADLLRKVANIVRTGTVTDVDHSATPPLVRVQLSEGGSTDWRPYIELRAGKTGTWNPPTAGECVVFLSPDGMTEGGYALPGVPTESHPTPSSDPNKTVTKYPDGAIVEYDHSAHKLKVTLPADGTADIDVPDAITVKCKTADVTASDSAKVHSQEITLDAPMNIVTGQLLVQGLLTYTAGMAGSGTGPGGKTAQIDGDMEFINGHGLTTDGGDIVAGDISLKSHRTSGVERGGDISDGPVP
jgi:phage baseplate assembly protein V